jgi:hypothetical protein
VSVYLLSAEPAFLDRVKPAFSTDNPKVFPTSGQVIAELLAGSRSKWEVIIVDVGSIADSRHLLDFVKSSAPLRAVRVMLVGTAEQLAAMGEVPGGSADAVVQAPCTGAQIAAAVTKLRHDTGPPPGGVIPPRAQL